MKILSDNIRLDTDGLKTLPDGQARSYQSLRSLLLSTNYSLSQMFGYDLLFLVFPIAESSFGLFFLMRKTVYSRCYFAYKEKSKNV